MMSRTLALLATVALAACTPAGTFPPPVTPAPTPADTVSAGGTGYTLETLPRDWHLGERGIDLRRAERELLAGRQPRRTVVVAVIDGGVDTAHADLRANLWRNDGESPANKRDDDANGYADDVHGWNFIGGADGRSVDNDTYEVTRLYVRCRAGGDSVATLSAALRSQCPAIQQDFERRWRESQQNLAQVRQIDGMYQMMLPALKQAAGTDSLTPERVRAIKPANAEIRQAQQLYLQLADQGITPDVVAEAKEHFTESVEYNLNPDFDPRPIVNDPADPNVRNYGNADITGPDAGHGTHVAGIIGAVRGNEEGIDGIATAVRIMGVRAVPNGDERDKDVANAIRYAADNGAHIINMSFGKGYSPDKPLVDAAARYAASKGVLLVHAAGNEGADVTTTPNFPNPTVLDGGDRVGPWIEVGAISWKGADSLVATFSNYSQTLVDVFAPGVDILSTVPGGAYERESGTSMAAPVVTGVAALLMSYYPSLTAADVKRILLETATRQKIDVLVPGTERRVPFATLSTTGAVISAYEALKRAEAEAGTRP
jgi:subtilisin family serine protease